MKRIHVYSVTWYDYDYSANVLVYAKRPLTHEKIDQLVSEWVERVKAARSELYVELGLIANVLYSEREKYVADRIDDLLRKTDKELAKIVGGHRTKVLTNRLNPENFKPHRSDTRSEGEQYEEHRIKVRRQYATDHLRYEFDQAHPYDPNDPARGIAYNLTKYRRLSKRLDKVLDHHGPLRMLHLAEVSSSVDLGEFQENGDSLELFMSDGE